MKIPCICWHRNKNDIPGVSQNPAHHLKLNMKRRKWPMIGKLHHRTTIIVGYAMYTFYILLNKIHPNKNFKITLS